MCTGKHMGTHTGHHPISWSSTYTSAHSSTYTVKHTDTYTKLGHMLCTHTSHKHTPTDADTHITHKHEHAHAQVIAVRIKIHTHTHTWAEPMFRHALLLSGRYKDFHGRPFSLPPTAASAENTQTHKSTQLSFNQSAYWPNFTSIRYDQ